MKERSYQSIRGQLKTGDIVLFSGRGPISAGIKLATNSQWSHVGVVIVIPEYEFVCVWESTTLSNLSDLATGEPVRGVQLVPLSERVNTYQGNIAIRQLEGVDQAELNHEALIQLRKELAGRPYEQRQLELLRSAYDGPFGANQECLSSIFCSELSAESYQALGLLNESLPSNEYTPADFSEAKNLTLTRGHLGPEIVISGLA
ncbi:hypothetical protein MHM95_06160 [Pseudoalteromonas sp. CnMc7-15]|uniref:hypothetical protein n=1 Tax=unclassified Pseudoalteromonas TaxID=194690 RepID=UPI001EF4350B|nr:hypothetical protein [Pseudoalteromonas sp. CnMc7-15]MCG7565870.1 hypothetical protein [Pseudoalteromonas sp. CnMc7-15]